MPSEGSTTGTPSHREAILDAALEVFAADGFDRASLRAIATKAGVLLSLVTYHFGSKLRLYRSVFERYQRINDERLAMLRSVDLAAPDALEGVVDAFLHLATAAEGKPDLLSYRRLVLREVADPSNGERQIISELFDPMSREFIQTLSRLFPSAEPATLRWAYIFCIGALTLSVNGSARERALAAGDPTRLGPAVVLRGYIIAALSGMRDWTPPAG